MRYLYRFLLQWFFFMCAQQSHVSTVLATICYSDLPAPVAAVIKSSMLNCHCAPSPSYDGQAKSWLVTCSPVAIPANRAASRPKPVNTRAETRVRHQLAVAGDPAVLASVYACSVVIPHSAHACPEHQHTENVQQTRSKAEMIGT